MGRIHERYTEMQTALVAENEDLREGQFVGMRDGEQCRTASHRGKPARGSAVQLQLRGAAAAHDFDITPQDSLGVAGAERLHRGFLRGKPPREMNGGHPPAHGVVDLAVGEDAAQEALAVALDRIGDTVDVGRVDPEADDVWHDLHQ
jgi:hypothetical protein